MRAAVGQQEDGGVLTVNVVLKGVRVKSSSGPQFSGEKTLESGRHVVSRRPLSPLSPAVAHWLAPPLSSSFYSSSLAASAVFGPRGFGYVTPPLFSADPVLLLVLCPPGGNNQEVTERQNVFVQCH